MQTPTTRRARKAATRQRLKDAARSCFADTGLRETSIGSIARGAGVAHGTFYVHFDTKEALVDELLAELNQDLAVAIAPVWTEESDLSLEQRVRASAVLFLETLEHRRAFVELYAQRLAAGLSLDALRDGINPPAAALMTAGLAAHATRGGVVPPSLELTVQGLLALWLRLALQALFNPQVSSAHAVDTLVHMTLGALQGPR